jgi:acyl dehydratase
MNLTKVQQRGLYFEEFQIGQKIISVGRTITESDIVSFAGLTGDYNLIHTDSEFSKTTPFGQRVAHGLLCLSIGMGLATRTGFIEGTVLAFREITEWKFIKPVFIGDTIHVELEVMDTKPVRRIGGGLIVIKAEIKNQSGEVTARGSWEALIASQVT